MKRLLKSWVFWGFVVLPPLATLVYFGHRVEEREACPSCLSERSRFWLGFGTEKRLYYALSLSSVEAASRLRTDILDETHEHRWTFWRFFATPLVGQPFGGGTPGRPRWCGEVATVYEASEEFRKHLLAKPREEILEVLRHDVEGRDDPDPRAKGAAWLKEFFGSMPP